MFAKLTHTWYVVRVRVFRAASVFRTNTQTHLHQADHKTHSAATTLASFAAWKEVVFGVLPSGYDTIRNSGLGTISIYGEARAGLSAPRLNRDEWRRDSGHPIRTMFLAPTQIASAVFVLGRPSN